MNSHGRRGKRLLTTLGTVPFARSLYQCEQCHQSRFPDDQRLDIVNTTYSPGVRRLMARAGSQTDFEQAADDLRCYAGLKIEPREIERIAEEVGRQVEQWLGDEQEQILRRSAPLCPGLETDTKFYISFDGTGVPVRSNELVGRRGRQADGSARTRETKLGCVFTQVGLDKEGYPRRDPDSTTYVGAIESSALFGWRMYAEALRRGLSQAKTVIVLTDGARYNRTIVQTHFAGATHIVDLFHAYEHLSTLAQLRWGPEAKAPKAWRDLLEAGKIDRLVRQAGKQLPTCAKNGIPQYSGAISTESLASEPLRGHCCCGRRDCCWTGARRYSAIARARQVGGYDSRSHAPRRDRYQCHTPRFERATGVAR